MRVVLIHWKPAEAVGHVERLENAGFAVSVIAPDGAVGLKGITEFANAIIIDLNRLPLQGGAVGSGLRRRAATRRVPLIFVGGAGKKVARIRELLPDATYTDWGELAGAVQRAIRNPPESPVVPSAMAGYSGTPLAKKLGIKSGILVGLIGAPDGFEATLEPLPEDVRISKTARGADRVVIFVRSMQELVRRWSPCTGAVADRATIWVAWPKKASGIVTDITEPTVRAYVLKNGWVDYKICAIDETWSGLAFAKRKTGK